MKYNLTFWQRFWLWSTWLSWYFYAGDNRKTWHEVKRGMEKHDCKFTIPFREGGFDFWKCEHEGCSMCEMDEKYERQHREYMARLNEE